MLVDPATYQTDEPDVFAGGDLVTGPKFAIDAIAAGKEAAVSIHRFVHPGQSQLIGRDHRDYKSLDPATVAVPIESFDNTPRQHAHDGSAEEAKKTDAEKIANLTGEVESLPKKVAEALREHLVALHEIPKERAELFLTGDNPELMLRQVTALLEDSGSGGSKRKNYVNQEGGSTGKPAPGSENAKFASSLFGGSDDD